MTKEELFEVLLTATTIGQVEQALAAFEAANISDLSWQPIGGRENNRGIVEVSADPGRALVERLTNGIDAILEIECNSRAGPGNIASPREAAAAWLNVPETGLSDMTPAQRRVLAQKATIRILPGGSRETRIVEVIDRGIGLSPREMPSTILSLNESNKLTKLYLAGTYGQGGSSTFAVSRYTFIASRSSEEIIGFTLVRFEDLPPEKYKTGHYVYLALAGGVLTTYLTSEAFPRGTHIRHFGYDLSNYGSPLGPNSVYGMLNQVLFDPICPVWLDDRVHNYRRVIKGSRNALNGAIDDGDAQRGPNLAHSVRMFYVSLGDFGRIGVEYWVLEKPTQANKKPTAAFIHPNKSIILTLNGQNHAELSSLLVRKLAELPYLSQRLICHIDCNYLSPQAKRLLFVSNREDARRGFVSDLIQEEIIRVLKSDDDLTRLNNEAREQGLQQQDDAALQQMRNEVARILKIQGIDFTQGVGGKPTTDDLDTERPTPPPRPRPRPSPIVVVEPPTYIRLLWDEEKEISFYPEQRRYLRIETDANSNYHNPNNPSASRLNFIVEGPGVAFIGSTSLQGGRLRAIFEGTAGAGVGMNGTIRVELSRTGLQSLSDERDFSIVARPPARPSDRRISLPPFEIRSVEGPEDEKWTMLGWPDQPSTIASSADLENGVLVIYYSMVFPKYASTLAMFERRDTASAASFDERYKIWLAAHSLLLYQDQQSTLVSEGRQQQSAEGMSEEVETLERQERCRMATLAAIFAAREIQMQSPPDGE